MPGHDVAVPFLGGRGDATQDWTDVESFVWMEPQADGFRNYLKTRHPVKTEELLLDKAALLGLVRAGDDGAGWRLARARRERRRQAPEGVLTERPGQLTNDFFVSLLDNDTFWELVDSSSDEEFIGYDRGGRRGEVAGDAYRPDLRLELAAACDGRSLCRARSRSRSSCGTSFKAWVKVMNADRFDVTAKPVSSNQAT